MTILKLWYHIIAGIQYFFYKTLYGSKLKIGKGCTWRRGFSIMKDIDAEIGIGEDCFFNNNCSIAANKSVEIGKGCLFGENVKIYDHNHNFADSTKSIKVQGFSNGEVYIGPHCWVGSNVTILKGTVIGENCVIGAGCVVDCEVPAYTIVKSNSSLKFENIIK